MKKYIVFLLAGMLLGAGAIYYATPDEDFGELATTTVYETEVDGPNDCASFETYDPELKVCSFECTDEQECLDLQRRADDEFATWADELEKDSTPVYENTITEDSSTVAVYAVSRGEQVALSTGADEQEYRDIWDAIKNLSPDNISDTYVDTYQVFSDSTNDTLAFVDDEDGNGKWEMENWDKPGWLQHLNGAREKSHNNS